jgi:predicted DNA-binding transcriptional regulator AlpA
MASNKNKDPIATKDQGTPPEEKKPVCMVLLDAGYLESLERLNRQCNGNALLRLKQIIGDKKKGLPALLPIGKTMFWKNLKDGVYPFEPVKLGKRTTAFYYRDIMALIANAGSPKTTDKGAEQ